MSLHYHSPIWQTRCPWKPSEAEINAVTETNIQETAIPSDSVPYTNGTLTNGLAVNGNVMLPIVAASEAITADEIALYDRQIRAMGTEGSREDSISQYPADWHEEPGK